jgi:hypothetical protein
MNEDLMSPPEIDYLAKDYASFRQLMLDHFSLRVPGWSERSEADLGIAITEVLAYVADYLSYYQDAVATEAYLGTARRRPSIKRHVRLLDYVLHEGCNARAWVQVQVKEPLMLPQATQLLTDAGMAGLAVAISPHSNAYDEALSRQARVFETMYNIQLFPQHNEIRLYAEEGEEVSLPMGSTSALLCDPGSEHNPGLRLKPGDVLIFEEVKNTTTGAMAGAEQTHRHAVRLTGSVSHGKGAQRVYQVTWNEEDALPFPLRVALRQQGDLITDISVARGNIVLADHGQTIRHETLPAPQPQQRYRPYIGTPGLASAVPYHHEQAVKQSAHQATQQDARAALPLIALFQQSYSMPLKVAVGPGFSPSTLTLSDHLRRHLKDEGIVLSQQVSIRTVHNIGWELHDTLRGQYWLVGSGERHLSFNTFNKWRLRRDLLSSDPFARDYTVDLDEDRRASIRFGFGASGKQPQPGDRFQVTYRIGGGEQGNVRADTITHIVTTEDAITGVRNPLSASGGTDPEDLEKVRDLAPYAFRAQKCCVTKEDYAAIARQHPQVANVVTRLEWPGNLPVVTLYVQREQGKPVDRAFLDKLSSFLDAYRLAGHAFAINGPYFVGLCVTLTIWLQLSTPRSKVEKMLAHTLSNAAGGFFAPDKFTFGQPVYQSQLLATVMAVPGVERVEIEQFCRFDTTPTTCEEVISPGPLEIARLDNDEAIPSNGRLSIRLEGGL